VAGAVSIASDANLGNGGTVAMSQGTALKITASGTYTHAVTMTGDPTFSVNPGVTAVWSGLISDGGSAGTVEVAGGGIFNPTNTANSYSGGTIVRGASTLRIAADGVLGAGASSLTLGDAATGGILEATTSLTLGAGRAVTLGAGGGTVQADSGATVTIGQAIAGTGGLTASGAGTVILTGANAYTGNTTVSGTLQLGNGVTAGSVAGNIADNGALIFAEGANNTFAGVISGTGTLTQNDAGHTLTLTGADTYTGLTTITAGSLSIGNGGTFGSIAGNVADNASLIFNRSDSSTYAGVISGAGSLTQAGAGTLILTGDSTVTGPTTINGTLQLGNGGAGGSVASSAIFDNGALVFDHNNSFTVSAVIANAGGVQQIGSGTTILTADNTYSGGTTITTGTLQLGNDGTTGSVQGPITDNGNLAFNRSDNITLGNAITGSGALTQNGSGILTIASNTTYGGGTTIAAGTLQIGNGGVTGSVTGNIADNGALVFNRSDSVTESGTISGSGTLTKTGAGALILTGNNNFTGLTTITSGTLQVGNGGTTGALRGDVADGGALVFNRSDTSTYQGAISGAGSVSNSGAGTTILTGNSSYTGGTSITAGTIQLGNGGTTGAITGNVADAGTLAFARSDAVTFAGVISGSGGIDQRGPGVTTLTGTSSFTGVTNVSGGTLLVNGSAVPSSGAVVQAGGTIGGTGAISSLNVANGGTVAPGTGAGSIGILNVSGNLVLASGANYAFDTTSTTNDLLAVSGSAALNGTLIVNPIGSGFTYGQVIPVVSAGSVTGGFSSAIIAPGSGSNLLPVLQYDATHAYVTFVPASITPLLPTGTAGNDASVSGAIDFAITHDAAAPAFAPLGLMTPATLTKTLSQLAGETATGIQTAAVTAMDNFLGILLNPNIGGRTGIGDGGVGGTPVADTPRLRDEQDVPHDHTFSVWANAHGLQTRVAGDDLRGSNADKAMEMGGEIGVDYTPPSGNGSIGLVLGMENDSWKIANGLGTGHTLNYQSGLYYSRRFDNNYFDAAFSYARYNIATDRVVTLNGANVYHAKLNATNIAMRAEYGHFFDTGIGRLTPYVRAQGQDLGLPDYTETTVSGSPQYALSYSEQQHYDFTTELGTAWSLNLFNDGVSATVLSARLGWVHDFTPRLTDIAAFAAFPGASFTVNGASPSHDSGHVRLGINQYSDNWDLSLSAESLASPTAQSYGGSAGLSYKW
jgi:autotransporter-associated beta strand protein